MKNRIDRMLSSASDENRKKAMDAIMEYIAEMEYEDPEEYWELVTDVHEAIHGCHFDEETARFAVSKMKNDDNTTGEKWSLSDTMQVAASNGIQFDKFNEYDWYYTMNMAYSDFYKSVGNNTQMYISLAKDWISDADAPEGKAFKYWKAMMY